MSYVIVEIPKDSPSKGFWVEIVAENWIQDDILYLPDNSYSPAYKRNMLIDCAEPDVENWESYPCFKVIHRFETYEEARHNLPRAEKGLAILPNDPSQTGRGCRQIIIKSRKLPGEITTEQESDGVDDESYFASTSTSSNKRKAATKEKGPAKRPALLPGKSSLPLPPSGLQNKNKKGDQHDNHEVETIRKAASMTPQQTQTSTCFLPVVQTSKNQTSRCITDSENNESSLDVNSNAMDVNDPNFHDMPYETSMLSVTKKIAARTVLSVLAQMNEKLNVIEKTIAKPVVDERGLDSSDEENNLPSLPLTTLEQFEKLEQDLGRDKTIFNELVLRIRKLGKRNTKHPMGDYVRRAWSLVLSDAVSKDVNWLGRRDKRVNGGNGKRGIKDSFLSKAFLKGIKKKKIVHCLNTRNLYWRRRYFLGTLQAVSNEDKQKPSKQQRIKNSPLMIIRKKTTVSN